MDRLGNTTWEIIFGNRAVFNVIFNADGSAKVIFPEGSCAVAYCQASLDGKFMFQSAKAIENMKINEAFFGIHQDREGAGHWCEPITGLHDFRMMRR